MPVITSTRKKSRMSIIKPKENAESKMNTCSQTDVKNNTKEYTDTSGYDFNFDFGEVFLLFEKIAKIDENKLKVDDDGLIEVLMMDGSHGYITPK